MSAIAEAEQLVAAEVAVAGEPKKQAEKPIKEKKPKAPKAPKEKKPKQPKATVHHPPYFQMIKEALLALNERGGSSPYAIAKYMEEKHKDVLPSNYKKILGLQLKNSAVRGKLIKIKASYKLSETAKKEKVTTTTTKAAKVNTEKKPRKTRATTTTKAVKKSEATKKAVKKVTKKVGPKKTKKSTPAKPKQPKSIKSPAAKRAKRAVA
ncbi:hypothetical protein ACB092_02G151300 [Castanea dentata]